MYSFISKSAIILVFSLLINNAFSQVTTGGNASVTFTNGTYIDISPILGYKMNKLNIGVSPFYAYKQVGNAQNKNYTYGGRVFGQYVIYQGAYLNAEMEATNTMINNARKWIFGIPLGAGFEYEIAKNTKAQCTILYDVLLDKNSLKDNPEIRGGVVYSF